MTLKVILNPYSNRWNAQKRWPEVAAALHSAGINFELAVSEYPRATVALAARAAEAGCSPIVAAGGDGTIGDVVNGLVKARGEQDLGVLGVLPLGTGNDLASTLGIPPDISGAVKVIAAGRARRLDVGQVNGLYFANNSAVGLEPYVTTKQIKITRIKGILRYLVAAVQGILDHPTWNALLEWDGGRFEGPISLVSVGNGPRTGGLFFMTPHADPFDGRLTFVVGYRATRLGTFAMLPKTMNPTGEFVRDPGIWEINTTKLRIRLDHPSPAHTDGEIFSEMVTDLNYSILPGAVQVLVP